MYFIVHPKTWFFLFEVIWGWRHWHKQYTLALATPQNHWYNDVIAKYLERKFQMQIKKSKYFRGAQTESSHISVGAKGAISLYPIQSIPLTSIDQHQESCLSPWFFPWGQVRLEGASGHLASQAHSVGLVSITLPTKHQIICRTQSSGQQGMQEKEEHPLTAGAALWDWEKANNRSFSYTRGGMK